MSGAVLFGVTYQQVYAKIAKVANLGNITLIKLWNVNTFLMVAVVTVFTLLLFYFLEHGLSRKDKLQ